MGYFITARSRIEQTDKMGYWRTLDNELYMDDDGSITITPRYLWTDGYTFPQLAMAILGDKNKHDVRPSHGHDLFCRYHEQIKVTLSLAQLRMLGYLKEHNGKIICEDIPNSFLEITPISKFDADNKFKRMMVTCSMPEFVIKLIRFGVVFNINWLKTGKKSLKEYKLYKEDLGLVNGL